MSFRADDDPVVVRLRGEMLRRVLGGPVRGAAAGDGVQVEVTVTVGGHGTAGAGMTADLSRALVAAGFRGDPGNWRVFAAAAHVADAGDVAAWIDRMTGGGGE